jgi:flagellin
MVGSPVRLNNLYSFPLRQAAEQARRLAVSVEVLSSGHRLNRAQDDAASLSIAERLRAQVVGEAQAGRNIQDAISVVRIGMEGVQGLLGPLQRIRELAVQAANGVHGPSQRAAIQLEIDQLKQLAVQAYQLAQKANMDLSLPTGSRILQFQVGADVGEAMTLDYTGLRDTMLKFMGSAFGYAEFYASPLQGTLAFAMGGVAPPPNPILQALMPKVMDVTAPGGPGNVIRLIDETLNGAPATGGPLNLPATSGLLGELAKLGAAHNRLAYAYAAVMTGHENHAAAESRLRDADLAAAYTVYTRGQLQQRASLAMVAQANAQAVQVGRLIIQTGH